jgi:hypothetical protein
MKELSKRFINQLIKKAEEPTVYEDLKNEAKNLGCHVDTLMEDYYDDMSGKECAEAGQDDGEIIMARKVLKKLGIKFNKPKLEVFEDDEDDE